MSAIWLNFATVDLYLKYMNIKATNMLKMAENTFIKYFYSIGVHLSTLVERV
jgi:hypothetical protein